jgi:hypothetical protein
MPIVFPSIFAVVSLRPMSARLFPLLDTASQSAFGSMPERDVAPRGEPRHGGEGGHFVEVQELCVGPADKPRPVSRLEHGQKRIVRIPEGAMRFLPTEVQALRRVFAALAILREGTLGIEKGGKTLPNVEAGSPPRVASTWALVGSTTPFLALT